MTTRLYLHNTSNATTGLPTTKQSAQATAGGQSVTVNKNMTTTIGTTQTSLSNASAAGYMYWSRWVSDILSSATISANTWTFSFGLDDVFGSSDSGVRICIFVWRPSTTTKIANICDAVVSQAFVSGETGYKLTIAGSAVSGIQSGDVICVEFMTNCIGPGATLVFYYDGNTAVTTNATAATSVASYIETPENITLGAPTSVNCTVTTLNLQNKFITKI